MADIKHEPIKIETLKKAVKTITKKFSSDYHSLLILVGCKTFNNKYFIFQELTSFPLQGIEAEDANNSLCFFAHWTFLDENKDIAKKLNTYYQKNGTQTINYEDVLNEKEIKYLNRHKNLNNKLNKIGTFNQNWGKELMFDQYKCYTDYELRLENVDRINIYEWGFEIFSPLLILTAITDKCLRFPANIENYEVSSIRFIDIEMEENNIFYRGGLPISKDLYCYWSNRSEDNNDQNEDFDHYLDNLLESKKEKVRNVGQKDISNIIL
jgi:hypothetical protein